MRVIPILCVLWCMGCALDVTGPSVVSIDPGYDAYASANASRVSVVFSEPIDWVSAQKAFMVQEEGGSSLSGNIVVSNTVLIFQAETVFARGKTFRVTIGNQISDVNGNEMGTSWYSKFRTGGDDGPCLVNFVSPTNLEASVGLTNSVRIRFSRPMDPKSVRENFVISPSVEGTYTWNSTGDELVFQPLLPFSDSSYYTVTLGKSACDSLGIPLGNEARIRFSTGADFIAPLVRGVFAADSFAPIVADRYLSQNHIFPTRYPGLAIDFSQPMDRLSVEQGISFSPQVPGLVTWREETDSAGPHYIALFTPTVALSPGERYTLTIPTSLKNEDGLSLGQETRFVFSISTNMFVRLSSITDWSNVAWPAGGSITPMSISNGNTRIRLHFISPATNGMRVASVQQGLSVKRLFGTGPANKGGQLLGFTWTTVNSILSVDIGSLASSNTYMFTIKGGSSGVQDCDGNYLQRDQEVLFYAK